MRCQVIHSILPVMSVADIARPTYTRSTQAPVKYSAHHGQQNELMEDETGACQARRPRGLANA